MKKKINLLILALACFTLYTSASNINVLNATLTGQNTSASPKYTLVKFDLSWDNSWRYTTGPSNFDAAWVFVKYRVTTSGPWLHATLSTTASDHSTGTGPTVPMTIRPGDTPTSDGKGVFVYRTGAGTGTVSLPNMTLRWNYGTDGVADAASVQIRIFAVEMVYIPQGPFYIGDGSNILTPSPNAFCANRAGAPYTNYLPWKITSENAISFNATSYTGTNSVCDNVNPGGYTLPAAYPKGYYAFWCMKYEISQRQYLDFFNTLKNDVTPRGNRNLGLNNSTRNMLYWDGAPLDDMVLVGGASGDRACNNFSWSDACAYADWACLRPMTELEYEKACRGTDLTIPGSPVAIFPVNGEYAWGNTNIFSASTPTVGDNSATEGYGSCIATNCNYNFSSGPLRCGIFAAKNCTTAQRQNAGATYYGVMEMTGDLYEMVIEPFAACYYTYYTCNTNCPYTNANGDGALSTNGHATGLPGWGVNFQASSNSDCSTWPVPAEINSGYGWSGFRGGYYSGAQTVSDRSLISVNGTYSYGNSRSASQGFRAVRSAPAGL